MKRQPEDYKGVYADLPQLESGYEYYELSELTETVIHPYSDDFVGDYAPRALRYVRPSHLYTDYRYCSVNYNDIMPAPYQTGFYSVGEKRNKEICYLGDINESEGNGGLVAYSEGKLKVGKIEGLEYGTPVFLSRPVLHFVVMSNGAAQMDYILRELRSDYVHRQIQNMETLFAKVERQDLRYLKIAVPSLELQDEILRLEKPQLEKFKIVFSVINTYFDETDAAESAKDLNTVLEAARSGNAIEYRHFYNALRQILESFLRAANRKGLLHDRCLPGGKLNVAAAIHFMCGDETYIHNNPGVKFKSEANLFPELLQENVKLIWKAASERSHQSEARKEYCEFIDTPFLLYSIAYLLCDVLIWFGKYVEAHPDPEMNRQLWIEYK